MVGKQMSAFDRKYRPSDILSAVIGNDPVTRAEATKKIWEHFKSKKLNQGRDIKADDKLKPLFGKDQITMFEVGKILNGHLQAAE